MSQLLIIDVQNTYEKYFPNDLPSKIIAQSSNYSQIFYCWDDISGQDLYSEVSPDFLEDEEFYDNLNIFSKNYAFLRGFMDKNVGDEEVIKLGKFLLSHNIHDGRSIYEDKELHEKFKLHFKDSEVLNLSFDDYTFYLPDDLIDTLRSKIKDGVVLCGGGRNECLKEIALLLDILDISYSIDEELTY